MCWQGVTLDESLQNDDFLVFLFQFYQSCDGLWFRCWARTAIRLNTMGVELRCGCEVGTNWMTVALLRMKRKPTAP